MSSDNRIRKARWATPRKPKRWCGEYVARQYWRDFNMTQAKLREAFTAIYNAIQPPA